MRYTTIIDISEMRAIWTNHNTTRLYLYLCLKCGYRDDDRDQIDASLHRMEADTGLTFSAVRNAIRQLTKAGLLTREDEHWRVKKWHMQAAASPRPRQKQAKEASAAADMVRLQEQQREEHRRAIAAAVQACTAEELRDWIAELKENRSLRHHGTYMPATKAMIAWAEEQLEHKQQ